jgi:hypothetical protein
VEETEARVRMTVRHATESKKVALWLQSLLSLQTRFLVVWGQLCYTVISPFQVVKKWHSKDMKQVITGDSQYLNLFENH